MSDNGPTKMVERRTSGAASRVFIAAVALLALTLAASCGGASGNSGGQQPSGGDKAEPPTDAQALGREPLGEADAPVVLIEYADYQ